MAIANNPVKFSYVANGASLPSVRDNDTIYFVEQAEEIWVGGKLIANNADISEYQIKSVEFAGSGNCVQSITLNSSTGILTVTYGTIETGDGNIECKTTAEWNQTPATISVWGTLYVYSDHQTHDGHNIPGLKVGDGVTPITRLPFTDEMYSIHVSNGDIHVTSAEKDFWNNKMRCMISPSNPEALVFTTD